jgi:hypothetical protein
LSDTSSAKEHDFLAPSPRPDAHPLRLIFESEPVQKRSPMGSYPSRINSRPRAIRLNAAQEKQPPAKRCEHRRLVVHRLMYRLLANELAGCVS